MSRKKVNSVRQQNLHCWSHPKREWGKGGKSRNAWKEARQAGSITSTSTIMEAPCTKVPPYNNCPLVLCFLKNCPKAVECIQCLFDIPRRPIIVPLDIVLEYEGIWVYPDPTNKGKQLPSTKYTTKYYCVKRSCIMERFPYFSSSMLLKVSSEVRSKLTQLSILEQELVFAVWLYRLYNTFLSGRVWLVMLGQLEVLKIDRVCWRRKIKPPTGRAPKH